MRQKRAIVRRCAVLLGCLALSLPGSAFGARKPAKPEPVEVAPQPVAPEASALVPGKAFPEYEGLPLGKDLEALMVYERGRVDDVYRPLVKATPDVAERDRLHKEAAEKVEVFSRSHHEFTGQASGWDVSILSGEFRHGAGHAMRIRDDGDVKTFFLLANGTLWKLIYQASSGYEKFADVVDRLKAAYGRPKTMETRTLQQGDKMIEVPERAVWDDGTLTVVATDLSALYQAHTVKWAITSAESQLAGLKATDRPDPKAEFRTSDVLRDISTPSADGSVEDIVDEVLKGGTAKPKPAPDAATGP